MAAIFRQALERELIRIEIPAQIIKHETEGLIDISIAKTNDRSVVGSLTLLALETEWMADDSYERGEFDLDDYPNAAKQYATRPARRILCTKRAA